MARVLTQWIRKVKLARAGAMYTVNPNHLHPESLRKSAADKIAGRLGRFEGICFDMDGTLTVSNIDFGLMRRRVDVPRGDLFTVMESWHYDRAREAVKAIIEVETEASQALVANPKDLLQPGLLELFQYLKDRNCRVALITRNSALGAEAFFEAVGVEWKSIFDLVLTREFRYVKPDKRLLEWVASEWNVDPHSLLMVGDSKEDIEVGAYSGAATCHFDEKGNKASDASNSDVSPSFSVSSLSELLDKLREIDASGQGISAVAPPAHVRYLDSLIAKGHLPCPAWSFPGLAAAHGYQEANGCQRGQLLHLGCGNGSLTKLIASMGVACLGVDTNTQRVSARGIESHSIESWDEAVLPHGALGKHSSRFDVVMWDSNGSCEASQSGLSLWQVKTALPEIKRVLKDGGRLSLFIPVDASMSSLEPALQDLGQAMKTQGFDFKDADGIERNEDYLVMTATKPGTSLPR